MSIWILALIISFIFIGAVAFISLWIRIGNATGDSNTNSGMTMSHADRAVDRIFNDEFREELKNRGRLYFEKIIGENAMFMQQDLRLTTSELNTYLKTEITKTLKDEFAKYEQSITDAKQIAIDSIEKTKQAVDEQRQLLVRQLETEIKEERERRIAHFEDSMADVVNHYVLAAIGNQIDLNDQLEYIISEFEASKKDILEDIRNGT